MTCWNEQMPAHGEREAAISAILEQGLAPRQGLAATLRTALDVRILFFGVADCIFLSILAAVLMLILLPAAALQMMYPAPMLFLVSPALYALLLGLTAWKEVQSGLLDWKRSCRLSELPSVCPDCDCSADGGVWRQLAAGVGTGEPVAVEGHGRGPAPELDAGDIPVQLVPLWPAVPDLPGGKGTGTVDCPAGHLGGPGRTAADVGQSVSLADRPAGGGISGPGRGSSGPVPAGIETVLPGAEERRSLCFQLNM